MEELKRKKKVLNMMITGHSILEGQYKLRALLADVVLLVSGICLTALTFVDFNYLESIFKTEEDASVWIGWFSISVFAAAMVSILLNWKGKAERHMQAKIQLSRLLNENREILDSNEHINNDLLLKSFTQKYDQVLGMVISIPDRKFNYLKARHFRKVEFSKYNDKYPAMPYLVKKIKFFFYSLGKKEIK